MNCRLVLTLINDTKDLEKPTLRCLSCDKTTICFTLPPPLINPIGWNGRGIRSNEKIIKKQNGNGLCCNAQMEGDGDEWEHLHKRLKEQRAVHTKKTHLSAIQITSANEPAAVQNRITTAAIVSALSPLGASHPATPIDDFTTLIPPGSMLVRSRAD